MKEFWKWAEEHNHYDIDDCEKGWRAALECVQNIACKGGILQNDFVIRKWIREELDATE